MKVFLILLTALFLSGVAHADAEKDAAYNDCILTYLKDAKLDLATRQIRRACDENSRTFLLGDKKRLYNGCILEHLVGVESKESVALITGTCRDMYL